MQHHARLRKQISIIVPVVVLFANENNPVDSLTVEQVRGIYAGEYTNWSQRGGANRVINPVTRLLDSGSQSAMDASMRKRKSRQNLRLRLSALR